MTHKIESKLKVLEAKKSTLFNRLQRLYDNSLLISDVKQRDIFKVRVRSLESTVIEIRQLQEEIVVLKQELKPDGEIDFQLLTTVDDMYCAILNTAEQLNEDVGPECSSLERARLKLPKLELPTFSGDQNEWPMFAHAFKSVHENCQLSNSEKLRYLIGKLTGKALEMISGFQPAEENYKLIWNTLTDRYEDKRNLASHYLRKIINVRPLSGDVNGLDEFLQKVASSVEALKNLQITDLADFIFLHIALTKLDDGIVKAFEMSMRKEQIPSFEMLITYIREQAKILSRFDKVKSKGVRSTLSVPSFSNKNISKVKRTFHSYAISQSSKIRLGCNICGSAQHPVYNCPELGKLKPEKRFALVKDKKLCVNCLSKQHTTSRCKSTNTCNVCNKRHHTSLHFNSPASATSTIGSETSSMQKETSCSVVNSSKEFNSRINTSSSFKEGTVVLSTAVIEVYDKWGNSHKVRALLDSASQSDFITTKLFKKLGLAKEELNYCVKGLGPTRQTVKYATELKFSSRFNHNKMYNIKPLILDKIVDHIPTYETISSYLNFCKNLPLADQRIHHQSDSVEVLIGANIFSQILKADRVTSPCSALSAIQTDLGYVVMGTINEIPSSKLTKLRSDPASLCCIKEETSLEKLLKTFWELDSVPSPRFLDKEDLECEEMFRNSVERGLDGRYTVSLPFKAPLSTLGSSLEVSKNRYLNLEKRLKTDPELKKQYDDFMLDYKNKGHMSYAGKIEDGYYLPHFAVLRSDSVTTRLRVVFDASVKGTNHLSLNDILYTGRKLQADIQIILLGFRIFPIAITADIRQMYRQIEVNPKHRLAQKILWRFSPDEDITQWRLNTVTFGVKPAPFLALRVLQQLAIDERNNFPLATKVSKRDFFMDDLATSTETEKEALEIYKQLVGMFKSGGFELVKWSSNSRLLMENVPYTDRFPSEVMFDSDSKIKILGLQWMPTSDMLAFKVQPVNEECTKRNILSTLARIFDPLGFLAPVTLKAKLIIKELWQLKVDWDQSPPNNVIDIWKKFSSELPDIAAIRVPRHISVCSSAQIDLIGFADASEKGYGAVTYIRSCFSQNTIRVRLACAKSKVAPMKPTTIARLELCAALLLAKLMRLILDTYSARFKIHNMFAYSDSEIVLHWLNASPSKWTTFVANRVSVIQENIAPKHWAHVSGLDNPADCLSRGLNPSALKNHSLWFEGPKWLHQPYSKWPSFKLTLHSEGIPEQKIKSYLITEEKKDKHPFRLLIDSNSSYRKLLRITLYILAFCGKLSKDNRTYISPTNLEKTELQLIKFIQHIHFANEIKLIEGNKKTSSSLQKLNPFLDKGLLRVGGRLMQASISYDHQHPILLPKNDHFTKILIEHVHRKNLHTGPGLVLSILRMKYWVLGGRGLVRNILQKCNFCFKHRPGTITPIMGDLPAERVMGEKPFLFSGVDYAGPYLIKMSRGKGIRPQKSYICLFICLSVKAIHLELASDLSTQVFLEAFKRFLARRGPCKVIYSDCGTNFIGARSELKEIYTLTRSGAYSDTLRSNLADESITWKFNPPSAPHFGGLWEAAVKSVKTHVKKVIGDQILTYEELSTVLIQIEALLNSRPLSVLSADPSEPEALTPAHFLLQRGLNNLPSSAVPNVPINRLTRYQLLDKMVQDFWKRWHQEYLHTLQIREKWSEKSPNLKVGTVVLIKSRTTPPLKWPLGIIESIHPGPDSVVRVVTVRTAHATMKRPVVALCPLPTQ